MAAEFLEPLRESEPDNVDALVNLGIAYLRMGRLEEARETLLRAEQLDDKRAETYVNLALCYERLRRPTLALGYAERAEELAPKSADVHYARGVALMRLHEDEEAFQALTTAASFDEADDPRIQQHLANVCVRLRLYPEALVYYQRLAQMAPTQWQWQLGQTGPADGAERTAASRPEKKAVGYPGHAVYRRRLSTPRVTHGRTQIHS
jgi:tetratricopeptide (TPR) repeat protein